MHDAELLILGVDFLVAVAAASRPCVATSKTRWHRRPLARLISTEVMRRVQRDLDLEESRLEI